MRQLREDLFNRGGGGHSVLCAEHFHFAVVDELVGPADADDGSGDAGFGQSIDQGGTGQAEATLRIAFANADATGLVRVVDRLAALDF